MLIRRRELQVASQKRSVTSRLLSAEDAKSAVGSVNGPGLWT